MISMDMECLLNYKRNKLLLENAGPVIRYRLRKEILGLRNDIAMWCNLIFGAVQLLNIIEEKNTK